jgi:hypothetical protein
MPVPKLNETFVQPLISQSKESKKRPAKVGFVAIKPLKKLKLNLPE